MCLARGVVFQTNSVLTLVTVRLPIAAVFAFALI